MQILKRKIPKNDILFTTVIILYFCLIAVTSSQAAKEADYDAIPPFTTSKVKPSVLIMLDNSGSMKNKMYPGDFNPSKNYFGIFDSKKNYRYDSNIPVDTNPYSGLPYNVSIDTNSKGAFVEDDTCDINSTENNCWSGNFLNWLTTKRIDSARMVLVGGKVEDRNGYPYLGSGIQWKIMGNNERSDHTFTGSYEDCSHFTPFSGPCTFKVVSPAQKGTVQSVYRPYAQARLMSLGTSLIVDSSNSTIGEIGLVKDFTHEWKTVHLQGTYSDPIVIAGPLTYDGRDPSTIRIRNVNSNSFEIRVNEWPYRDGSHTTENAYFIVVEKGNYTLPNGNSLIANRSSIDSTWHTLNFIPPFTENPIVLTSVTTNNQTQAAVVRVKNITTTNFMMKLQGEEKNPSHGLENVDYLAIEPGEFSLQDNETKLSVERVYNVDENWKSIYPGGFLVASIDTFNGKDTCSLRTDGTGKIKIEEEKSEDDETHHAGETVGFIYRKLNESRVYNVAVIVHQEPRGLLHDIYNSVRLGLSFYNYKRDDDFYNGETTDGGTLKLKIPLNPFVKKASDTTFRNLATPIGAPLNTLVDAIEHYPLVWGTTPIAENLVEVANYFSQYPTPEYYPSEISYMPYEVNPSWDPFLVDGEKLDCIQSNVLIFTDGYPYKDGCVPSYLVDADGDNNPADGRVCSDDQAEQNKHDNLDDVAWWFHNHDLRPDIDGLQTLTVYTVGFAGGDIRQILQDTAENAGGKAYAAADGLSLRAAFSDIFRKIQNSASSGTAAGVVSQSRSGVGGVYQAVFYQKRKGSDGKSVNWAGDVHALFIDEYGYMREDTNGNHRLDIGEDTNGNGVYDSGVDTPGDFIVIQDNENPGIWNRYYDFNGDYHIDGDVSQIGETAELPLEKLNFVWSASDWLNSSSLDTTIQRNYTDHSLARYIFTFIDADQDMVVDPGEQLSFELGTISGIAMSSFTDLSLSALSSSELNSLIADISDPAKIYPYLSLYPSFEDTPDWVKTMQQEDHNDGGTAFRRFLLLQTKRLINFVRGQDETEPLEIHGMDQTYFVPGFRNRSGDFDDDPTTTETWRLGDIVYSTPTMIAKPGEGYHLLYQDGTYSKFLAKYQHRRGVVYVGANDGMLHAFNAGFFDADTKEFKLQYDGETPYPLGMELWAYIPYNLLPHLYWLTETDYGQAHVYYVDLKPKVFDAKIFQEEAECNDANQTNDYKCIHPAGWGTVLVGGMRFGGGKIGVDVTKNDPASWDASTEGFTKFLNGTDTHSTSAYFIIDITNPETPPQVLAELSFPGMGFTTCYPSVVPIRKKDENGNRTNSWYLVFGNGPAASDGSPDTTSLKSGTSSQKGKIFVIDLLKLGSEHILQTYSKTASVSPAFVELDDNSFISDPITVDYDLDFAADAVYFGTVEGDHATGFEGKMRRIILGNADPGSPDTWTADSVLIDLSGRHQPITAAPTVGMDKFGTPWIFFGTGRYYVDQDEENTDLQGYYGVMEPMDSDGNLTFDQVITSNLLDVTNAKVYADKYVEGVYQGGTPITNWDDLEGQISNFSGWYLQFSDGEINLGPATLLGDLLSFTTYLFPSGDPCNSEGSSSLYATYYRTGTAYYLSTIGSESATADNGDPKTLNLRKQDLGKGLSITPNLHVGREVGSTAVIQTSTGAIKTLHQINPGPTKSGIAGWKER